ncbi:MAG: hypothetical protein ABIH24_07315 [Verrucomicrobiota bacterium]
MGSNLWAALHTEPAAVMRFDIHDESWEAITLPEPFDNCRSITCNTKNLFIGLQNRRHLPSSIYKLPLKAEGERCFPSTFYRITSGDWYRLRRGEDQLAWGKCAKLTGCPAILLSRRAGEEISFLSREEREKVLGRFSELLKAAVMHPVIYPVENGQGWLITLLDDIKIIFRYDRGQTSVRIATIQKGASFDPEAKGIPPPFDGIVWEK